jgi:hypothetical protein
MQSKAGTPQQYLDSIADDKREAIAVLRRTILENLPKGFKEEMSYGMLGYVVPHSKYPAGYHCNPKLPLPFLNVAAQKNFVAVYHMGLYADSKLLKWFTAEFPKHSKAKLDMGKSCLRFRKYEHIPFELIGKLASKMTPDEWIAIYEKIIRR